MVPFPLELVPSFSSGSFLWCGFLVWFGVLFFFGGFLPTIFFTFSSTPLNYKIKKQRQEQRKKKTRTQPNTTIKQARGWVFSCLDCGFLVVMFLCLFNRANFHAHPTPYTYFLIDVRILKSFFILNHRDCRLRTYRVACCAATTVLLSFI